MEPAIATQLVGTFVKLTGETLAELKRQQRANLDLELLRLKRQVLKERLEILETEVAQAVKIQKANAQGDLVSRGLAGSSLAGSQDLAIDRDANAQLDNARREYSRAIEEIALMERQISESTVPYCKMLWSAIRRRCPWRKPKL